MLAKQLDITLVVGGSWRIVVSKKFVRNLRTMVTMSLAFAACAITFTLPAQDKQPQWKDREEYDTADAAFKDANATTRLQKDRKSTRLNSSH